jgi:hypothetical protein
VPVTTRDILPISDDTLSKVADVAGIPAPERHFFYFCVRSLVFMIHGLARRRGAWSSTKLKASTRRIASAASALERALSEGGDSTKDLVRLAMPDPRPKSLDSYSTMTRQVAAAARLIAGTEPGNPWRLFREIFIQQLKSDAAQARGSLTLNQRTRRGSLMKALDLLRPHLPAEFSKETSFSTVRRMLRRGVKQTPE